MTPGRPNLLDEQWYAVQTRPRHEKVVATQLRQKGISSYLPLYRETHFWSDRRKLVQVPLFAGYTFIHAVVTAESLTKILRTQGVLNIVGARGGTPIPDQEIESVQALLASGIPYATHPFIKIGDRVRIRGGSLDGIEGTLLGRKGEGTLVVSIELIQRAIAVRLEGYDLEPA